MVPTPRIFHPERLNPFLDKLKSKQPSLLLALGDSNMDNTHFTGGGKQWPELLHTELKHHYGTNRVLLLNAAISGNTVLDALHRFETDVLAHRPTLTIFCLGSNDADHLTDEDFQKGYLECLDRLASIGSAILAFTPPPIMERKPEPAHIWRHDTKRRRKVEMIRELVRGRDLTFVDLCQIMIDLEDSGELKIGEIMDDEVHLNARGHQLVYRIFAPVFQLPPTFLWERNQRD